MSSFYCCGLPDYSPRSVKIENDEQFIETIASIIESMNDGTFGELEPEPCVVQCSKCNLRVKERQEKTKQALNVKKQ